MKKNLLLPVLLAFAVILGGSYAFGQVPCVVDPQYTSPGIYPNDTIPDGQVGVAYNEVVQFVFPLDTVIGGFPFDFDSFLVIGIQSSPAPWLVWECDQFAANCHYISAPPQLTRGCVLITGTPAATNPAWPAYDSVIVQGEGWVTLPFPIGAQAAPVDIPIYFRVGPAVSVEPPLVSNLGLEIAPNPTNGATRISFNLVEYADVRVSLTDMMGKEIAELKNGKQEFGAYDVDFNADEFPAGIYFVRLELNDGEYVKTQKVITTR